MTPQPEIVTAVHYSDLCNPDFDIRGLIQEPYGSDGLGVIATTGVPDWEQLVSTTIPLAHKLMSLSPGLSSHLNTSLLFSTPVEVSVKRNSATHQTLRKRVFTSILSPITLDRISESSTLGRFPRTVGALPTSLNLSKHAKCSVVVCMRSSSRLQNV